MGSAIPPLTTTRIFEHAFHLADHCVFLIPISKYWSSEPRLELVSRYGGLDEILHLGTGRQIGFDIGFPFGAMYFARGYRGPITETRLPMGSPIPGMSQTATLIAGGSRTTRHGGTEGAKEAIRPPLKTPLEN